MFEPSTEEQLGGREVVYRSGLLRVEEVVILHINE